MNKNKILILSVIGTIALLGTLIATVYFEQDYATSVLFKKHVKSEKHNQQEEQKKSHKQKNFRPLTKEQKKLQKLGKLVWTDEELHEMTYNRDHDFKHECKHMELMKEDEKYYNSKESKKAWKQAETQPKQEHKESDTWEPIRFHVNYDLIDQNGLAAEDVAFIKEKLIPAAQAYFQTTFRVHRLDSPIVPNSYYQNNKCGQYTSVPSSLFDGVDGADMVMIINAMNAPDENFLAYASKCPQGGNELSSGRPTLGKFMINTYYLEKEMNTNRWFTWVETSIHEMMHAMGFSPYQWKNFLNNGGATTTDYNGQTFFQGPNVVAYGQKYFDCSYGDGVPIENDGGSGSAGAHWERTALGNEGMTASDFGDAVYSMFTLMLFKDSGWYDINEDNAQELVWEKGSGCSTMQGKCDRRSRQHTCVPGQEACSFDYSATGLCSGRDTFAPNCPYWAGYSNGNCVYNTEYASVYQNIGGAIDQQARCWNIESQSVYSSNISSGCFISKCKDEVLQVQLNGSWETCDYEGQVISNGGTSIKCPDKESFCLVESDCPYSCSAQGTCKNSECQCYEGYTGAACQVSEADSASDDGNTNEGSATQGTAYTGSGGNSEYCDSNDGLEQMSDGNYGCCNYDGYCCPLHATYNDSGYCQCVDGYEVNYYTNSCIKTDW